MSIAPLRVWPGAPYPLGATWDGVGVNFALFSEHATRVELCLFESADAELESLTKKKDAAEKKQFKKGQSDLEKELGF